MKPEPVDPKTLTLTPRARHTLTLCLHALDWVPSPKTATGSMVSRSARPGEIATKPIDCPACQGAGQRRIRGVVQKCDDCAGSGKVKVDPQTGKRPLSMARPERFGDEEWAAWSRHTSSELERIQSLLLQNSGVEGAHDQWTAALARRDLQYGRGSFPELATALERLRNNQPAAYSLIMKLAVYQQETRVFPAVRQALEVSLELLAGLMPKQIVVPPWLKPDREARAKKPMLWHGKSTAHEEMRQVRTEELRFRVTTGETTSSVALEFGLSQRRVQQITRGQAA